MTRLTEIDGVGPAREETLLGAEYRSIDEVADADVEDLEEALGPSADAEKIKENAAQYLEEHEDEDEEEDDPRAGTRSIVFQDRRIALYVVKGLVDENLRHIRRGEVDRAEEVRELAERVLRRVDEGEGGSVIADLDDLSYLYTSIRNIEKELQSARGVGDLIGDMRDIRTQVQDRRDALWPDT